MDADSTEKKPITSGGNSGWKDFFYTIAILVAAVVVAYLMIFFVFRSYQVEGPSMQPTLHNGDKLIIWKVPKTWAEITGNAYIPPRGSIIVFKESGLAQFGQSNTKQLIKRVIGLPGDTVVVGHGVYTIYDKNHPHGFDPDKTLPYGKTFHVPVTTGNETVHLGKNQLFVSGDNRTDSLDSRDFGPINASQIVGRLVLRIWPLNRIRVF